jgi:diguanylate cyclase (GGDEF)-like protein
VTACLLRQEDGHYVVDGGTSPCPIGHRVWAHILDEVLRSSEREPLSAQGPVPGLEEIAPAAQHWVLVPTASGEARAQILVLASVARIDNDLVVSSQMLMRQAALAYTAMENRAQLQWQAWHDGLTHLPNRRLFLDRLTAICAVPEEATKVALLYIDLDGFKDVNDVHGHLAGDQVLTAAASRLTHAVRDGDVVARLGGDEFAVLVERADPEVAEELARRLETVLREPIMLGNGVSVSVGASIGVRQGEAVLDADGLMHAADVAMYDVKAARRAARGLNTQLTAS